MASSRTNIEWTSDDAQIVRTLSKVERGFDKLNRKMDKVERTSRRSAKSSRDAFDKVGKELKGVALGIIGGGGIIAGFQAWSQHNQQIIREADKIADKYDEIIRKFQMQAGLSEAQTPEFQKRIGSLAQASGVGRGVAGQVATELSAGGVGARASTGRAGQAILDAIAAVGTQKEAPDPEGLTNAVIGYLKSQGNLAPSAADIEKTSLRMANLVLQGQVTGSEFSQLADIGADLSSNLSQREQLAAFGGMRESISNASKAAQGLRRFVSRTSTIAGIPTTDEEKATKTKQLKALDVLGLTPEQVDLVGEGLVDVIDTYSKAINKLPEEQRAGVLKNLFGMRGVSSFRALQEQRDRITELATSQDDSKAFEKAVAVAGRGKEAFGTRLGGQVASGKAARDKGAVDVAQAMEAEMLERGYSGLAIWAAKLRYLMAQSGIPGISGNITPLAGIGGPTVAGEGQTFETDIAKRLILASHGDTGSDVLNQALIESAEQHGFDDGKGRIADLVDALERNTEAHGGGGPKQRVPAAANQNGGEGLRG